ncbi:MAG: enoyl-CoA hydratase/isomerase family protein [Burkholderiaceae bacterium]
MNDDRYARYQRLRFDRPFPGVLRVTLDSPLKMNAMDPTMHREISEVWADIERDEETRAVLLTSAGRHFSAGGDMSGNPEERGRFDVRMQVMKEARALVFGMLDCSRPIVCAARGWSVGAGLVCLLLSDISIVARDARMSDGHVKIGVAAGDHAAIIWPLLCGMARAKYHLLLGEPFDGEQAERMGMVSLAVDDGELDARALALTQRLADGAPFAIRATKRALNSWLRLAAPTFESSLAMEFLGFFGPEAAEGRAAFVEKRPPVFESRVPF